MRSCSALVCQRKTCLPISAPGHDLASRFGSPRNHSAEFCTGPFANACPQLPMRRQTCRLERVRLLGNSQLESSASAKDNLHIADTWGIENQQAENAAGILVQTSARYSSNQDAFASPSSSHFRHCSLAYAMYPAVNYCETRPPLLQGDPGWLLDEPCFPVCEPDLALGIGRGVALKWAYLPVDQVPLAITCSQIGLRWREAARIDSLCATAKPAPRNASKQRG